VGSKKTKDEMMTDTYIPSPNSYAADQVATYERTNGAEAGDMKGVPVIILTTTGRKTGALRKSPLMRVKDGDEYAVVASKGGAPEHPVWYLNLKDNPTVELQDGAEKKTYRAHVSSGAERDQWWAKAAAVWPDYNEYQKKTTREIPLVVLSPVEN
jgi:F420H(2)-dependent quinone reductase